MFVLDNLFLIPRLLKRIGTPHQTRFYTSMEAVVRLPSGEKIMNVGEAVGFPTRSVFFITLACCLCWILYFLPGTHHPSQSFKWLCSKECHVSETTVETWSVKICKFCRKQAVRNFYGYRSFGRVKYPTKMESKIIYFRMKSVTYNLILRYV